MTLHASQTIKATSTQDLDPLSLANSSRFTLIINPSVLPHEMYALEPGDPPFHTLSWKTLGFLSHVKRRTNDDRFPLALWEVWLCSQIGVPIPDLIGSLRQCPCNVFQIDCFGDHLQTCQVKSAATEVHDWVLRRLKTAIIDSWQKQKANKRNSDGHFFLTSHSCSVTSFTFGFRVFFILLKINLLPTTWWASRVVARKKILYYHHLYIDRPDPIAFMSDEVDTSGRIYDDFLRLLFVDDIPYLPCFLHNSHGSTLHTFLYVSCP